MISIILRVLGIARDIEDAKVTLKEKWWKSRTLWVNAVAAVALVIQWKAGFIVSAEDQMAILTAVNLILRFATKEPLIVVTPREESGKTIEEGRLG